MNENRKTEWGKIEKIQIATPYDLVSEKANVFNENYPQGEIRCLVTRELKTPVADPFDLFVANKDEQVDEENTIVKLNVEVPSLNNYRIQILKVTYKISQLYPCKLYNSIAGKVYDCESQEKFETSLNEVLTENSVSRTLSILFSQIAE